MEWRWRQGGHWSLLKLQQSHQLQQVGQWLVHLEPLLHLLRPADPLLLAGVGHLLAPARRLVPADSGAEADEAVPPRSGLLSPPLHHPRLFSPTLHHPTHPIVTTIHLPFLFATFLIEMKRKQFMDQKVTCIRQSRRSGPSESSQGAPRLSQGAPRLLPLPEASPLDPQLPEDSCRALL